MCVYRAHESIDTYLNQLYLNKNSRPFGIRWRVRLAELNWEFVVVTETHQSTFINAGYFGVKYISHNIFEETIWATDHSDFSKIFPVSIYVLSDFLALNALTFGCG